MLDGVEAEGLRAHLRENCPDCAANLRESLERVSLLSLSAASADPGRALRARVIGLVNPAPSRRRSWFRSPLVPVVCGRGLGFGLAFLALNRNPPDTAPLIVSRLSPPPVPFVETSAPVGQLTKPNPTPRAIVSAPPLDPELAAQRNQIASLEAAVHEKDAQLAAAQLHLSQLSQLNKPSEPQSAPLATSPTPAPDVSTYQSRIDQLTRQLEFYRTALEQQRRELGRNLQLVSLLSGPDLKIMSLGPTEQGGASRARAVITSRSGLFLATGLPSLQPGRSFQLWLMRRSSPAIVGGGVFRPDQAGAATLEIHDAASLAGLTAMAVTEEPAGGSPLPTGHKILIGLAKS